MTVLRSKCCNRLDKTVAVTVNGIWDTDLKSGNFLASSKESQSIKGFGISTRSSVDSVESEDNVEGVVTVSAVVSLESIGLTGSLITDVMDDVSVSAWAVVLVFPQAVMENAVIVQSVSAINFFIRSFPFVIKIVYGIVAVHFYRSAIDTIGGVKMLQKNIKILRR